MTPSTRRTTFPIASSLGCAATNRWPTSCTRSMSLETSVTLKASTTRRKRYAVAVAQAFEFRIWRRLRRLCPTVRALKLQMTQSTLRDQIFNSSFHWGAPASNRSGKGGKTGSCESHPGRHDAQHYLQVAMQGPVVECSMGESNWRFWMFLWS